MTWKRPQTRNNAALQRSQQAAAEAEDGALVLAMREGHLLARTVIYDKHGAHVLRVLTRVLGPDRELEELLHDVFVEAFSHQDELRDGCRLKAWLTSIAVFVARNRLRQRKRRSWLVLWPVAELPEPCADEPDWESRELLRCALTVLGKLSPDEQIAFALRHIEGMELVAVADACGVSLSGIKRRLARAERRFAALATKYPPLAERLLARSAHEVLP